MPLSSLRQKDHPALFNALKLGVFAIVAALVLGLTYSGTAARIAEAQQQVEHRALLEVVESLPEKRMELTDRIEISEAYLNLLHLAAGESIQVVRDYNGFPVAFIIPTVAPDGYSGAIRLIVGVDLNGEVTGVRAIEHRETPGLGDRVDIKKSNWVNSFIGRSLANPANGWAVKKDGGIFDAFTGATITPRAVVHQLHSTLEFFREYQAELVAQASVGDDTEEVQQ